MIVNIIWYCFFKRKYGRRKELRGWSWSSNFNCEACVDVDNRWPAVSLLAATWHYPLNWCLSQVPSSDTREPNSEGKQRFWICKKCKAVTTTRFGTVLYKSKMKLKNWILLAFCFTVKHPFLKRDIKIERFQGQQWIGGIDSLESSVEMTSKGRVAEFAWRRKEPYRKSLDWDKNFKP